MLTGCALSHPLVRARDTPSSYFARRLLGTLGAGVPPFPLDGDKAVHCSAHAITGDAHHPARRHRVFFTERPQRKTGTGRRRAACCRIENYFKAKLETFTLKFSRSPLCHRLPEGLCHREAPRDHRRRREAEGSATGRARSTTAVALSDVVAAGETQLASSSLPLSSRVRV